MNGDGYMGMRVDGVLVSEETLFESDAVSAYIAAAERNASETSKFYNLIRELGGVEE